MLEFRKWMEGGFSSDQKATVQTGVGVRGSGNIGASRKKNPPDGLPTPSSNAPLALKDRAKGGSQMSMNQMNMNPNMMNAPMPNQNYRGM